MESGYGGIAFETYKGASKGGYSSSLPPQAIPLHKKNDKWKRNTMDRLEEIGLSQIRYNMEFDDLYTMVEGNLVYSDYTSQPDSVSKLIEDFDEIEVPSYVKHYDLIGQVVNYLTGKYSQVKDKFRVDFLDPISENEFDRELTNRLLEYSQQLFQIEFQKTLFLKGLDPNAEFDTEEEQQEYLQYLEERLQTIATPPEILSSMQKSWKPLAAEWAENTLENDKVRFNLDELDRVLFKDKLLTGRWFKHYRVGYDYYKPERWDPRTTFFSQDIDIKYPQHGEYVGRIHEMSGSDLLNTYGYLLSEKEQEKIANNYDYVGDSNGTTSEPSFEKLIESNFHENQLLPGKDYYERESNVALQEAFGIPLGEETFINSEGEQVTRPAWIPSYHDDVTKSSKITSKIRRDINPRKDTIRVVEAYFRSFERVGILFYENDLGILLKEFVTDEILEEFVKEKGIKKLRSISLDELEKKEALGDVEPNTICFTYAPRIYKGIKLCTSETKLNKDLYFVDPMPFQIKGDSNLYDVSLPVTGLISTSEAMKLRPYQIGYNIQMNLIQSYTEKEIGLFFLFDVNFLTSDFADSGDSREALLNVADMAKTIGLVPIDGSKQNMRDKQGMQFNTMMAQDISYTSQIQTRIQTAEYYKQLLLQQLGITQQDLSTPSQYSTAEGIKIGQQNSFVQIEHIFEKMDSSRLKDMEVHLAVAQYCQTNEKDISVRYTKSDGQLSLLRFSDEWFHHRKFGLIPTADSKKRKELEMFKEFLLNTNTFSNDLVDYAKVITSDSMAVIINELSKSQEEARKEREAQRQHEMAIEQSRREGQEEITRIEQEAYAKDKELDRENKLEVARIHSLGRAANKETAISVIGEINKESDRAVRQNESQLDFAVRDREIDRKERYDKERLEIEREKLRQEAEKIALRREQMETDKHIATINKN